MNQREQTDEKPAAALLRLVNGFQVSQAIHVAATLGIADLLKEGPRSADDLAAATGADSNMLYRLLRALAAVGVFREEAERRFARTPLGECLQSDAPEPVGPWALFTGEPYYWQAWGHLLHVVRTGETAMQHLHGMDVWQYREQHPEANAVFDRAMTANSQRVAEGVLGAYDFSRFGCVVDVAGGQGALLAAILTKHRSVQGVLFDQPHVVAASGDVLHAAGVVDRCRVVSGDFFKTIFEGGDAYVLKAIIHDWADEEAVAILKTCRAAITPDGRLLVIEWVVGAPNENAASKFSDLNMSVMPGGRERTYQEFETLFSTAGFQMVGAVPTQAGVSIIEGVPV